MVEILQALVDQRRILLRQRLHDLLGSLHVALAVVVEAGRLQRLQLVLVRLRPVDHADGVGSLRILGIDGQNLLLPVLGIVQSLDAEINARDLLHAVDIVGLLGQNLLEDVDGLVGGLQVVRVSSGREPRSVPAQWPDRSSPWAAWDRVRWPSGSARSPLRSERSCKLPLPCSTGRGLQAGCTRSWKAPCRSKSTASAQKRAGPFMFVSFSFRLGPAGRAWNTLAAGRGRERTETRAKKLYSSSRPDQVSPDTASLTGPPESSASSTRCDPRWPPCRYR